MINILNSGSIPLGNVTASLSYERDVGLCIVVLVQGNDYIIPVDLGQVVHDMVEVGCPAHEFRQLAIELNWATYEVAKSLRGEDGAGNG